MIAVFAAAAAQLTPPVVDVRSLTDSAERQTLPVYQIECLLSDSDGGKGYLRFEQAGGRGVRATTEELRTLPAWRRFVSTPVSLRIVQDDAGLFQESVVGVPRSDTGLDLYRWDAVPRVDSVRLDFRDRNGWVTIRLSDAPEGTTEAGNSTVLAALITRRQGGEMLPGAHVGFCSISSNPQRPLTAAEEAEYRTRHSSETR